MDVRRMRDLESHLDAANNTNNEQLHSTCIMSGSCVKTTILQQLFYLIELTCSITLHTRSIKEPDHAQQSFITLLNNPPKYKKGRIKGVTSRHSVVTKKVKVNSSPHSLPVTNQSTTPSGVIPSSSSAPSTTTIKISIKGSSNPTNIEDDLDGDSELQESMTSALTKMYNVCVCSKWDHLEKIEGGPYLQYSFYKWIQSLLYCKVVVPEFFHDEENSNHPTPIAVVIGQEEKIDVSMILTVCAKSQLARQITLFMILRFLQNVRMLLSRPRDGVQINESSMDVDVTPSSSVNSNSHHMFQLSEETCMLYENLFKLIACLRSLFFENVDEPDVDREDGTSSVIVSKFGLFVVQEEDWFVTTLREEMSRLVVNLNNSVRLRQDGVKVVRMIFDLLSTDPNQWVFVGKCISRLVVMDHVELARRRCARLRWIAHHTESTQKDVLQPVLDGIESKILKVLSQTSPNSPSTPNSANSRDSFHTSPSHSRNYQQHAYHPYARKNSNPNPYTQQPRTPPAGITQGFGNLPPSHSTTTYSNNAYGFHQPQPSPGTNGTNDK
ncbi:NELF-B [Acrasis kona]|uniref:NELF-B n=1 Tax=Acrasis kona TaxID=1008807 RepID=A0AAW2YSQ9_9EUKA